MKLPENIKYKTDEDEILIQPTADVIKSIIKQFKVKPVGDKSEKDVVKLILTLAFGSKDSVELPEGTEHLAKVAEYCESLAAEHRSILEKEAEEKEAEREKKAQDKALQKEAKEKEEKEYLQNQQKFEAVFLKRVEALAKKTQENVEKAMRSLQFPGTIAISDNGMGVVISDGATKDDIASAAASMIQATEGNRAMAAALQFVMGDLVNACAEKKIFRTKSDACKHVKYLIEEKTSKKFSVGNINACSLMAERIQPGQRKMGVAPSLYYFASKVVAPKLKDTEASKQLEMNKKFDEERNNVIELINDGKIDSNKALTEHVKTFKTSVGINQATPDDARKQVQKFLHRLFFATWAKDNLLNDDDEATFLEVDEDQGGKTKTMSVGELTDIQAGAMNNLQNLLLKDYNISQLIEGEADDKDDKGKDIKVPYFMNDPFTEPKKEEEKKGEDKKSKKDEDKDKEKVEEEEEDNEDNEDEEEDV